MKELYPDFFARFYDLIYHKIRDATDHQYFMDNIRQTNGKILEIGTGTGRFFIDALSKGADIYGIDISTAMTDVLKSKLDSQQHYRISDGNMVNFESDLRFDLIIAPFRVMMHISEKEDQLKAINNVRKHLNPGGKFIFDVFVPDLNYLIKGFDNHVDFDEEYAPGKRVRRIVTTTPDLINQIINVEFRFEWDEDSGKENASWKTPMRFFFRFELEHLIERSDFKNYSIHGDYLESKLKRTSKEFVVCCW